MTTQIGSRLVGPLLSILGITLLGCSGGGSGGGAGSPASFAITTTSLPGGALGASYSEVVSTNVPAGQVLTWAVQGQQPQGLLFTFRDTDALLSGTPLSTGSFSFTLKATLGAQTTMRSFDIFVATTALDITTTTLPDGLSGISYSQSVTAIGGTSSGYMWSSSGLPPGLSLTASATPTATLSGSPTSTGVFTFSIDVEDSGGLIDSQSYTITVGSVQPLDIVTTSLPDGTFGSSYSQSISAADGTAMGYSWSPVGSLPTGLTLTSGTPSATLSGIPTGANSYNFDLVVTDSGNSMDTQSFSLTIHPVLDITTTSLPDGAQGSFYSSSITASGGSGSGYTWTTSGNVPGGLSISAGGTPSGTLSGTPTVNGTFSFDVLVSDSLANSDTQSLTLHLDPELLITTTTLPDGQVSVSYDETVSATGGTSAGYDYSLSGNVPPGISVSDGTPDGQLTGMPSSAGTFNFALIVVDSGGNADTANLSMLVDPAPPLRLKSFLLENGRVGDPLTLEIEAADGGTPTFSVIPANGLPPGLTLNQPGTGSKTATITGMPTTSGHYSYTIEATDGTDTVSHGYLTTIAIAPRWLVYRGDVLTSALEELFAVDVSGGTPGAPVQLDPLSDVSDDFEYRFSWDGRWLFYIGNASGTSTAGDLFAIDMSTATPGTRIQLNPVAGIGDIDAFQVSHDDRWIVYSGDQGTAGVDELFAVDISGGSPFPISFRLSTSTHVAGADVQNDDLDPTSYVPGLVYGSPSASTFDGFSFSPDGKWLAYRHDAVVDNEFEVFLIDMSGTTPGAPQPSMTRTRVTGGSVEEFVWSNDSQYIAMAADWDLNGQAELFVVDVNNIGTDIKVSALATGIDFDVFTSVSYYAAYAFAPDVTSLYYRADAQLNLENNLYLVPIDQGSFGAPVQVNGALPTNSDIDGAIYSPDSKWLAFRGDVRVDNDSELWVAGVERGQLVPPQLVSHDPIAAGGDVQLFSTLDRNIVWASDSEHLVFRADTAIDNDIEAFSVRIVGGMPFAAPVRLNPTLPVGGDVGSVWTLPDGESVGLIGELFTDNSQNLYIGRLTSPGSASLASNMSPPGSSSVTEEIHDTADNDGGSFHSPDLRFIGMLGDQVTSIVDELWIVDISGGAPYPAPTKVNPTPVLNGDVFSFIFSR